MVDVSQQAARRWGLRTRIADACGGAGKFRPVEQQFAEWLGSDHVAPAVVDAVEPVLARYLLDATREGRLWGRRVGQIVGAVIGVVGGLLIGLLW